MSVFTKPTANGKKAAFVTALIMSISMLLSACSKEEHHEVSAVDKVQEAQELALENAPEAEIVELPAADVAAADGETGDATATDATTDEATAQDANNSETELEKTDAIEEAAALGEPAPSSATDSNQ